ncbi:hypothetical protein B0H65DRAFT_16441 [Neurospora tetraspora]|uniref:Secreted protein n=1 Tax=Neurospora tetraspora TaxID=94610 RepID=A0AAE0MW23_9PEZI|nr:hypothetical protein B0H65DRAFT_16441 [Neurospora tetraspora]
MAWGLDLFRSLFGWLFFFCTTWAKRHPRCHHVGFRCFTSRVKCSFSVVSTFPFAGRCSPLVWSIGRSVTERVPHMCREWIDDRVSRCCVSPRVPPPLLFPFPVNVSSPQLFSLRTLLYVVHISPSVSLFRRCLARQIVLGGHLRS